MAYLLDTHTFLWFAVGSNKLPSDVKSILKNAKLSCYISVASLWEITIKHQLKKLELDMSLEELFSSLEENQIEILDIEMNHLLSLSKLPMLHNDPFDRLIISQAISEKLTLLSKDEQFKNYKVKLFWK